MPPVNRQASNEEAIRALTRRIETLERATKPATRSTGTYTPLQPLGDITTSPWTGGNQIEANASGFTVDLESGVADLALLPSQDPGIPIHWNAQVVDTGYAISMVQAGNWVALMFADDSGNRAAFQVGDGTVTHQLTDTGLDLQEQTAPAAAGNHARVFARDNGSGKTQLCVQFGTGSVQVIATEP